MTKIVRDHYPAAKLPDDLRGAIDPKVSVRVVVETEEHRKVSAFSDLVGSGRGVYKSPEEALDTVRRLREEWN